MHGPLRLGALQACRCLSSVLVLTQEILYTKVKYDLNIINNLLWCWATYVWQRTGVISFEVYACFERGFFTGAEAAWVSDVLKDLRQQNISLNH